MHHNHNGYDEHDYYWTINKREELVPIQLASLSIWKAIRSMKFRFADEVPT